MSMFQAMKKAFGFAGPSDGAQTGKQTAAVGIGWGSHSLRPPERSIKTYREMRSVPTIALARMVATAPVKAAPWSYEAIEGTPDERVKFVQNVMSPLMYQFVRDVVLALDYGYQGFEFVWSTDSGRWVYRGIKALSPDKTEILILPSGEYAGVKNDGIVLGPAKSFVFTYDGEYGNFYGRSRHENIREYAYTPWLDTYHKLSKYTAKAAGTTPMVRYPVGQSLDQSGAVQDNYVLAQSILQQLGSGNGVTMPQIAGKYAEELINQGIDPKLLAAWVIDFIEPARNHGDEMLNLLRYWDALMLRGWFVPERSAIEASVSGSRADSQSAGDMVLTAADDLLQDIAHTLNAQVINPLLRYNFGAAAENSVVAVPGALGDTDKANIAQLVNAVLTNPANIDLLLQAIDMDAALDRLGYPKAADVVNLTPETVPVPGASDADALAAVQKTYAGTSDRVKEKIRTLIREGKPREQAVAIAFDMEQRGEL